METRLLEQTDKQYEVINFTYYDPKNSFFKGSKSDRARYTVYECCNKEKCDAFKRGKCFMLNGLWGSRCPYGKKNSREGFTPRARAYYSFLSDAKSKYEDHAYKLKDVSFPCRIGDYVHIGLPHLKNYSNPISEELISEALISAEEFTVDFVSKLINFYPRALMGGEITSYQTEHVPRFITQMKRYFPDMYLELVKRAPEIADKAENVNYVGKHARVQTLLPSKVGLSTKVLEWDGSVLSASGKDLTFWGLSDEKVVIYPDEKTLVEILENESVTEDTVFRDE